MYKVSKKTSIKENEKCIQEDFRDLFQSINVEGFSLKYRNISFNISNGGETDGVGVYYNKESDKSFTFLNETKITINNKKNSNDCFSNSLTSHIIQTLNYYNSLIISGYNNVQFLTLTAKDKIGFIDLTNEFNKVILNRLLKIINCYLKIDKYNKLSPSKFSIEKEIILDCKKIVCLFNIDFLYLKDNCINEKIEKYFNKFIY